MDKRLRELERQAAQGDASAAERLVVERARAGRRPMLRMQDYVAMKPSESTYWGHIGALEHFLVDGVEVVFTESDNDYQGQEYALLHVKAEGVYVLWHDYFGSCEGCDGLMGASVEDAFDYVKATMAEGSTRQFFSLLEAAHYLRETEDYSWSSSWGGGLTAFRQGVAERAGFPAWALRD